MSLQLHVSNRANGRMPRIDSIDHHTDVLREVLNKSFNGSKEAVELEKKMVFSPVMRGHSAKNSGKSSQHRSSSRGRQFPKQTTSNQPKRYSAQTERHRPPYTRPTGPEIVRPHIPSCSSLPQNWSSIHDRFIAYLATHAPLTENGKIPAREEFRDSGEICRMVGERFPRLGSKVKVDVIEKRLVLLDQAGDNNYFDVRYGAYHEEEWGRGI